MNDTTHRWLITAFVALAAIGIYFLHGGVWLSYDRADIVHGQIWRLFTGNFVHANLRHLAVDLAGLLLWTALAGYLETPRRYVILLLGTSLGVGLGLFFLDPRLGWYVGLSGVLHGLFAASAIALLSRKEWLGGLALGAALIFKILWEQHYGDWGSARWLGVPVVVDAHLYGAVTGLGIALALLFFRRA